MNIVYDSHKPLWIQVTDGRIKTGKNQQTFRKHVANRLPHAKAASSMYDLSAKSRDTHANEQLLKGAAAYTDS